MNVFVAMHPCIQSDVNELTFVTRVEEEHKEKYGQLSTSIIHRLYLQYIV